jgi:hypothetical protein
MIRAARVRWEPNKIPLITLLVEPFKWSSDITWTRDMDNYTTMVGPLIFSYNRQLTPQTEIVYEKTFYLDDTTVEILTNPIPSWPNTKRYPQDIVQVQYTFDPQLLLDARGQPCFVKAHMLNMFLKENKYTWRVGLVKSMESDKAHIEAVYYNDGKATPNQYDVPHEIFKIFGEDE